MLTDFPTGIMVLNLSLLLLGARGGNHGNGQSPSVHAGVNQSLGTHTYCVPGSYPIGVAAAAVVSYTCVVLQITGMNPTVCVSVMMIWRMSRLMWNPLYVY